MNDNNLLCICADNMQDVYFCYKYGFFPHTRIFPSDIIIHNRLLKDRCCMVVNPEGIELEPIESGIYKCKNFIPPDNIIYCIDQNGDKYNRVLSDSEKPQYLYHGTTVDNLISILKCGYILKSNDWWTNYYYLFGFRESEKIGCLYYGTENGCILKINTSKYKVLRLADTIEYCIVDNVSIDDLDEVEFYLHNEAICTWDKEDIKRKRKIILDNPRYSYQTPLSHISRDSLNCNQLYDLYNDLILG